MKKWIFLFLLAPLMCLAQTYQYLGVEDGLSNRRVYYIQKDSVGYMWFLTHEGIDRFNGKEFKRYQLMDGNQEVNSLLNFNWLYIDKEGTLWEVGRKGRIFRYDRLHDHFELVYKLPENSDQQIPSLTSYSWIDEANNIWLCNEDSLFFYNIPTQKVTKIKNKIGEVITNVKQLDQTHFFVGTEKGVHYAQLNKQKQSLTSLKKLTSGILPINELYFDGKTGKLFIGTFQQGILVYDSHTQKIIQPQHFLSDINVSKIKPLNEKELLIATDGTGIYKINTDTYQIEPYIVADYNRYNEMNGNSINDIYIDDEKRIWMANYPIGITIRNNQYSSYTWIKHSIGNKQSLLNDQVNSIIEDSDGDLWFGTNNGISHLNNKTGIWNSYLSNFEQARKNKNQIFTTLCEVSPGIIWAGGYGPYIYQINKSSGAIQFITPNKFINKNVPSDKYIQKILKDSQGDIWIGGYYNLQRINFQNKETRIYDGLNSITTIIEKNEKEMWIGCATGVYTLDKRTGKFERIKLNEESTYIYSLYADKTGLLYIGTSGSGLFIYSPQTKLFANYNTDNCTLISNNIYTILSANDNEILISTESGLTSFYPDQKIFHHWTKEMGLTSTQFNAVSGTLRKNNNFIFGGNNGAVEFNKNRKLPHQYSSKMIFSDFKLFYQTIYPGSPGSPLSKDINETKLLELKYNQNIFSIQVSSINYDYPTNILYSWKLEGFYEEWSKPSTENTIRYTNLAPGKYTLFVRAVSNEDKRMTLKERSIDIIVAQPFWLSFWAILIYTIIIILIAITALRIYILRKQRKASDEKIDFFINTAHDIRTPLTLIKAPLEEMQEKEDLSQEAVVNMNTALRNVNALLRLTTNLINFERANIYSSELYVSEQELNTFMTGIFNVFMPYAKVRHINFTYESNFRYSNVWFDKEKMESIMKNVISNALKYTLENGTVHIFVSESSDSWSVEVKDTGIGIPAHEQNKLFRLHFRGGNAINSKITGSGIGLMLVGRLVNLHKGKISLNSVENQGSLIKITFPKEIKNARRAVSTVIKETEIDSSHLDNIPSKAIYQSMQQKQNANNMHILVVEDNDELRNYLLQTLSELYAVQTCTNGKEAVELLKDYKPDLVISDIMMPEMPGDELCVFIKNNIETSHIPVILLTALNEDKNILSGLESGADEYVIKPFNIGILKATIANLLTNRALLRQKYADIKFEEEEQTDQHINSTKDIDWKFIASVRRNITDNINNPALTVDFLAGLMNMSRTSFYNKIKALTDQAPGDYIRLIRLNKAVQLLKEETYTVTEIAEMTGFNDAKYFREVFKKQFNTTPSKYWKEKKE